MRAAVLRRGRPAQWSAAAGGFGSAGCCGHRRRRGAAAGESGDKLEPGGVELGLAGLSADLGSLLVLHDPMKWGAACK